MTAIDFWGELDTDVLRCFADRPEAMTAAEVGRRVGISDDAARSVLTMLAQEGKVRILSVEYVLDGSSAGEAPARHVDDAVTVKHTGPAEDWHGVG